MDLGSLSTRGAKSWEGCRGITAHHINNITILEGCTPLKGQHLEIKRSPLGKGWYFSSSSIFWASKNPMFSREYIIVSLACKANGAGRRIPGYQWSSIESQVTRSGSSDSARGVFFFFFFSVLKWHPSTFFDVLVDGHWHGWHGHVVFFLFVFTKFLLTQHVLLSQTSPRRP